MNQLNTFSHEDHQEEIDVFSLSYPGQVPFQMGGFVVSATSLQNGRPMGGGLVAEFHRLEDAKNCYKTILLTNPNHEPILSEMDWKNDQEKVILDAKKEKDKKRKSEKEGREREYIRHMKNPFEFDTQTRQEMFNNDTGELPNQKRVIHDYRLLKGAYEFTGYDEEPDAKGPRGITRDSRRRATELFYEEVSMHNAETQDEDVDEDDHPEAEMAKDAWEEYYTRDERDEYFANLYENCDYQTDESKLFLYEEDEGLEMQEDQDEKVIQLQKGLKNKDGRDWTFLTGDRQEKEKFKSRLRRNNERLGEVFQKEWEEEIEFFESMREMYREQIALEEEAHNEDMGYREAA